MIKVKPKWFNGPIKSKYVDPAPAIFLDKTKEKEIKPIKPIKPWIPYTGKSNKMFKLESIFKLYRDVKT